MLRRNFLKFLGLAPIVGLIPISTPTINEEVLVEALKTPLRDCYFSQKMLEDIRNWGIDQVDETTRREIYADSSKLDSNYFSVTLLDDNSETKSREGFYGCSERTT